MADIDDVRERPARRRRQDEPTQPLAVIGIGVCAASLRSLEQLFASLDDQLDAAYVVAVGQQNGVGVDSVVKALSAQTDLPLKIAANGEKLEPGHIYVGGPEDLITFEDGHVRTRESE